MTDFLFIYVWVLGINPQILMLTGQAHYPQSYQLSPNISARGTAQMCTTKSVLLVLFHNTADIGLFVIISAVASVSCAGFCH